MKQKQMEDDQKTAPRVDDKMKNVDVQPMILIAMSPYGTSCHTWKRPAAAPAETKHIDLCRTMIPWYSHCRHSNAGLFGRKTIKMKSSATIWDISTQLETDETQYTCFRTCDNCMKMLIIIEQHITVNVYVQVQNCQIDYTGKQTIRDNSNETKELDELASSNDATSCQRTDCKECCFTTTRWLALNVTEYTSQHHHQHHHHSIIAIIINNNVTCTNVSFLTLYKKMVKNVLL